MGSSRMKCCCVCAGWCVALLTGCGQPGSSDSVNPAEIPIPAVSPVEDSHAVFPSPGELPRIASGVNKINGSALIASRGANVTDRFATLSMKNQKAPGSDDSQTEETDDPFPFAYAVYRFSHIVDPLAGLKIETSSHNIAPIWIALANEGKGRWEYPLDPEYSSVEIWGTRAEIDLDGYVNAEGELTLAVILADEREDVTLFSLQLVSITEVIEFTASNTREDGVELAWKSPSGCRGYQIYRKGLSPDDSWELVTTDPLDAEDSSYVDPTVPAGEAYIYTIRCAFGPFSSPQYWVWSSGAPALGSRLVSHIELEIPAATNLQLSPVNWYNRLGFIGVDTGQQTLLALQNETFLPGNAWHWQVPGAGPFNQPVFWQEGIGQPFNVFQSDTDNCTTITVFFARTDGVYAQVAEVAETGEPVWEAPVQVCEGPYQLITCFRMSRRIGVLVWNSALNQLEVFDSIDMSGRLWFDPDDWPWAWRSLESGLPQGRVDSDYSVAGETLCFADGSGELKLFALSGPDWVDYSPNLSCALNPVYNELVLDGIIPGSGLIYVTPAQDSIHIVRRILTGPWDTGNQVEVYSSPAGKQISEFAAYCPAAYSGFNYIAFIEEGNVYYTINNYWDLGKWFTPECLDYSGSCKELNIIRIGSDDEYHYALYATYLSENSKGELVFNFRAIDSRFIPLP